MVYADLLFIMNAAVTLLIIMITADVLKIDSESTKYISGSVSGGIFAFIILAPSFNLFLSFIVRMVVCAVIVLLSFRMRNIRMFLRCFFMFLIVSFLLAGITYSVAFFISADSVYHNNGFVYVDFGIGGIILILCASLLLIRILCSVVFSKQKGELIFTVDIFYESESITVKALYDSGNSLTDVFTGRPVIIVSKSSLYPFFDKENLYCINDILSGKNIAEYPEKMRLLPVRTLGNTCVLPAFTADKAVISGADIRNVIEKPCIAVSDDSFDDTKYTALINEAVTGQVI